MTPHPWWCKLPFTHMEPFPFIAHEDYVVLDPDSAQETTAGVIVLPASTDSRQRLGRVVAVGPGTYSDSGAFIPCTIEVGQTVAYNGADFEHRIGTKTYTILRAARCFMHRRDA